MSYYRTLLTFASTPLNASLLAVYKFEGNGNDSLGVYNATSIGSGVTFSTANAVDGLAMQIGIRSVNGKISLPVTGNPFSFTTGTVDKPFSIKANIRVRGSGVIQSIITKYSGTNNFTSEYLFYISASNILSFYMHNRTGTTYIGAQYATPLMRDTNYNVVLTYDGSGVWTGINMYLNSTLLTLAPLNSGSGYTSMRIGTAVPTIGNAETVNFGFQGMIDELYFFNGAISQTDVTTLQTQYYPNF